MQQMFGHEARLFRTGGDEFVAAVPIKQAEAFRDRVEQDFGMRELAGFPVSLSGTWGQTFGMADAELAARILDITLTSRGDGAPLAGVADTQTFATCP